MVKAPIPDPVEWLPEPLIAALTRAAAGREVHLVGGAIRDHWLGRASPDIDLVADGRAEKLGRRLADHLGGRFVALAKERFAAYRIVTSELVVDLWGRGDASIEADLARRDLTINSIAIEMENGSLLDPFGGVADLERRILRATTEQSFGEDPLRVLRLARFASTLDRFTAAPSTVDLARSAAPQVGRVAAERIRDEVARTLAAPRRGRGLAIWIRTRLYPRLWGGSDRAEPNGLAARLESIEPRADELVRDVPRGLYEIEPMRVAQALLFAALEADATARSRQSSLLTRRDRRRVTALVELAELPDDEVGRRWLLRRWGRRWSEAVVFSLLRGESSPLGAGLRARRGPEEAARELAVLATKRGPEIFDLPTLLDGAQVGELLDTPPGPLVGEALRALEREQVEGRIETAAAARAFVAAWRPDDAG